MQFEINNKIFLFNKNIKTIKSFDKIKNKMRKLFKIKKIIKLLY